MQRNHDNLGTKKVSLTMTRTYYHLNSATPATKAVRESNLITIYLNVPFRHFPDYEENGTVKTNWSDLITGGRDTLCDGWTIRGGSAQKEYLFQSGVI